MMKVEAPLIDVRNLLKTHKTPAGDFTAIKNLDVQVQAGEFVAIIGKSGSGKSTLINMLTGIDRLTAGEILMGVLSWAISLPLSIPLAIWLGNVLGLSLLARPLDYRFSIVAAALWLGLVIVIAIIASLLPAQNAARLTIRDALVYE